MHQFGSHDMCFEWNGAKSILDAEEGGGLQVFELEKYEHKTVKSCVYSN